MSEIDRRAVRVILALCEIETRDFAEVLGYDAGPSFPVPPRHQPPF